MNELMKSVYRRSTRDTQETLKEVIASEQELQGSYNQQREPSDGQSLIDKIMFSHYVLLRTTTLTLHVDRNGTRGK